MIYKAGISLAFVQLAASRDAAVIIADLRLSSEAEELVKENEKVIFVKCDVTEWKDLQNLIRVSEERFGDVPDVYFAGAGIFDPVRCPPFCLRPEFLLKEYLLRQPKFTRI